MMMKMMKNMMMNIMNFNVVFDDQDNVDVDDVIADHDDIKEMPLELMMQIRVCFFLERLTDGSMSHCTCSYFGLPKLYRYFVGIFMFGSKILCLNLQVFVPV